MSDMVDMARTPEDMAKAMMPMAGATSGSPQYPYGLCISLTHADLEKLGLDADCEVGDMVHLQAMAKVTSVSSNASETSQDCRIELQITELAVEDEASPEPSSQKRADKRYGKDEPDDGDEGEDEE